MHIDFSFFLDFFFLDLLEIFQIFKPLKTVKLQKRPRWIGSFDPVYAVTMTA